MLRGTRVGQAYIALHADGSMLDKDIADSLEKSLDGGEFNDLLKQREAADKERLEAHSKRLDADIKKFSKGIRKMMDNENIVESMTTKGVGKNFNFSDIEKHVAKQVGVSVRKGFKKDFDREVGAAVRKQVEQTILKNVRAGKDALRGLFDEVEIGGEKRRVFGPAIDAAVKDAERNIKQVYADADKADKDHWAERVRQATRATNKIEKIYKKLSDPNVSKGSASSYRGQITKLLKELAVFEKETEKRGVRHDATIFRLLERREAMEAKFQEQRERRDKKEKSDAEKADRDSWAKRVATAEKAVNRMAKVYERLRTPGIPDKDKGRFQKELVDLKQDLTQFSREADQRGVLYSKKIFSLLQGALRQQRDYQTHLTKIEEKAWGDRIAKQERLANKANRLVRKLTKERESLSEEEVKKAEDKLERLEKKFREFQKMAKKEGRSLIDPDMLKLAQRFEREFDKMIAHRDKTHKKSLANAEKDSAGFINRLGRLFGRRSRNNFLNLFGGVIGGATKGMEAARRGIVGVGKTFMEGFNSLEEGASGAQKAMAGFSSVGQKMGAAVSEGFASIAASGPAAVVAILTIVSTLAIMISVVGALVGIITAFASAVVAGLTGALAAFVPWLTVGVTGLGLFALAMISTTKAQKAMLKEALVPLRNELLGLGQLMFRELEKPMRNGKNAIQIWSQNLQNALHVLAPFLKVFAGGFAVAGDIFTRMLSGPGFKQFAQALGSYLPGIMANFSRALGGFLNGFLGMFSALMPYAAQFGQYLSDLATRFANWATSASGQNSISEFAKTALESFKALWNGVREFFGFFSDVLFSKEAQGAGQRLFSGIADAFRGMRDSLNGADLKKWLTDSLDFGKQLWVVMKGLWDIFLALYNSGTLQGVGKILELLGGYMSFMAGPIKTLLTLFPGLVVIIGKLVDPVKNFIQQVLRISGAGDALSRFGANLKLAAAGVRVLASRGWDLVRAWVQPILRQAIQAVGDAFSWLVSVGQAVGRMLRSLANSRAGAAFMSLLAPIGVAVNAIRTFIGWAERAIHALAALGLAQKAQQKAQSSTTFNGKSTIGLITDPMGLGAAKSGLLAAGSKAATGGVKKGSKGGGKIPTPSFVQSAGSGVSLGKGGGGGGGGGKGKKGKKGGAKKEPLSALYPDFRKAIMEAAGSTDLGDVQEKLGSVIEKMQDAKKGRDKKAKARLDSAMSLVKAQQVTVALRVDQLMQGLKVQNATLADFAVARGRIAEQLEDAKKKLEDAISLRDDFRKSVTDSIKSFAAVTTAEVNTLNGLAAGLTATDITANLQDKLAKIRDFQANLRVLRAQGLGDSAYKQIIEAGVEQGSAFAEALVQGGYGSVQHVNDLMNQIGSAADEIGIQTSTDMYQVGVNVAQGLLDGLTSMSEQLAAAAAALGNQVAAGIARGLAVSAPAIQAAGGRAGGAVHKGVKRKLKIRSPSQEMIDLMEFVGDGIVVGLDNQSNKVDTAAAGLFDSIQVSPEVAANASRSSAVDNVSGNDQRPIDLTVVTPTKDPFAVATEAINELVGRL